MILLRENVLIQKKNILFLNLTIRINKHTTVEREQGLKTGGGSSKEKQTLNLINPVVSRIELLSIKQME